MLGRRNPESIVCVTLKHLQLLIGWRAVIYLNKPAIMDYSFEPPTT